MSLSNSNYPVNNYADPGSCEHCASIEHRSHRHGESDFRIASASRPGVFHRTVLDLRGQFHCTCEWGQHRERELRRNRDAEMRECGHVGVARWMIADELWVTPSVWEMAAAAPPRLAKREYVYSESEYELFDGDELPLAPSAA